MTTFKENYKKMVSAYDENKELMTIDELNIQHYNFHSEYIPKTDCPKLLSGDLSSPEMVEGSDLENKDFSYPVVYPKGGANFSQGILLSHGLNEKSWDKYLVWAAYLAEKLQRPVILFPIAYHMNRAPKSWSDPRAMRGVVKSRLLLEPESETTFVNAALSKRLGAHPELFIYSGVHSYFDVCQLMRTLKQGGHPLFAAKATIDVFAYSIGAFLAEILFLNNPENLFGNSRLFLFAGGPTFDSMIGKSRYIMDLAAFKSLLQLRKKSLLKSIYRQLHFFNITNLDETWKGLYEMIHQRKGRKSREKRLRELGGSVCAVALKNDKVMPARIILKTLKGKKGNLPTRFEIIDFPYHYTHENPFPIKDDAIQPLVDRSFKEIFDKAVEFFSEPFPLAVH
jgi:pimeloyl-ACP methyl ester carboxylesterase